MNTPKQCSSCGGFGGAGHKCPRLEKGKQKLFTIEQLREYTSITELIEQAGEEWVDTCLDDLFDEYALCLDRIEALESLARDLLKYCDECRDIGIPPEIGEFKLDYPEQQPTIESLRTQDTEGP